MNNKNEVKMSFKDLKGKVEIKDFFDRDNLIKKELINDAGENNVKELASLINQRIGDPQRYGKYTSRELNINQIRKFYDEFLNIYNSAGLSMEQKKVRLLMMKANAEYSANRLKVKTLELFMKNRLDIVLKQTDEEGFENYLRAFKLHFEALVGYFPKK